MSALRRARDHRLGTGERAGPGFRCKSCRRTFNALTKTPIARLRKRELWIDHAQAMIESRSLSKTGESLRRSSDDRLSLASPVSRLACDGQAQSADRHRRGRRDLPPRNPSRAAGPICPASRASVEDRPNIPASIRKTFPFSFRATARARPSTRSCLRSTALRSAQRWPASSRAKIIWSAMAAEPSPPSRARRNSPPRRARAGQADRRGASPPPQQRQRLPRPPQAMAEPLQWRGHQKSPQLPRLAARARSLGDLATPQNWIKGAIGNGPYQQLTL